MTASNQNRFTDLIEKEKASKKDTEIQLLNSELEKERDQRKEERFFWVMIIFFIYDVLAFPQMQTWGGPIGVVLLQTIIIVAIAKRCQMEHVITLIDKIIGNRRINN